MEFSRCSLVIPENRSKIKIKIIGNQTARNERLTHALRAGKLLNMDREDALRALGTLGDVLAARGHHYEVVAIGGSGLLLLGLVVRATADVDVVAVVQGGEYRLAKPLPAPLEEAQAEVGAALGLGDKWLNPGPTDLLDFGLPDGFQDRVETFEFGGLTVHLAGRFDQICFKLYAAVDQGPRSKHFADLGHLDASPDELVRAAQWALEHDPSEGFRSQLVEALRLLGVESDDV